MSRAGFGAGQGTIYLANLRCNSSESSLLECRSSGPGYFCFHGEDAGVICKGRWDEQLEVVFQILVRFLYPHSEENVT